MTDSSELREALDRADGAPTPLAALEHLAEVRRELGRWEAMLARAALGEGASWADIGTAVGTSRQAAWERLRPAIKAMIEQDRRSVRESAQKVKAQARRKRRETADG